MSTSLKRQLAALAAPASSLLVPDRRRPSILFTPKDAAKYDTNTFYAIGREGLKELIAVNPKLFEPFTSSILFNEAGKKYERVMEDVQANENLDQVIRQFLLTLYPYMMLKASLKCLEWLVYRFHVERFNVDALMQCTLPYYDTKTFVLIVQILEIERYQKNQAWEWLVPCKQSGAPLRKAVLFDNSSSKFVMWLFGTFDDILQIHQNHPENLRIFLGFMASTIVGILNKLKNDWISKPKRVHNQKIIGLNILNKLFNLLEKVRDSEALKSKEEIFAMAYVVMSTLAVCCREIPHMIDAVGSGLKQIFKVLIANRGTMQMTEETFLLLNIMIDYLNRNWVFKNQRTFSNTLQDMTPVSKKWDMSNLAMKLLLFNLDQQFLTPQNVLGWVSEIDMTLEARSEILKQSYLMYKKAAVKKSRTKLFLTSFERQYPTEFQIATSQDSTLGSDLAKSKSGKDFVLISSHSDPNIRANAVKRLINKVVYPKNKKTNRSEKIRVAKALKARFSDDNEQVLLSLWKTKVQKLLKIFSPKTLLEGAVKTLNGHAPVKVVRFVLMKLCGLINMEGISENLFTQIINIFVPFLFPRTKKELRFAKVILQSQFAIESPILNRFSSVFSKDDVSVQDVCSTSFQIVSSLERSHHLFTSLDSPAQLTFACLLLSESEILTKLLPAAEKINCGQCTSYPVTELNFDKCLRYAHRRQRLSFELVLTALMRAPNADKLQSVLKFVWKFDQIENRDAGMKFLSQYLKECFQSDLEQLNFWTEFLRSLNDTEEDEYHLIRSLQFTASFLKNKHLTGGIAESKRRVTKKADSLNAWELVQVILCRCLSHSCQRVRSVALACLKNIQKQLDPKDALNTFLDTILEYEFELSADGGQLPNVIAHSFQDKNNGVFTSILSALRDPAVQENRKLDLLKLCGSCGTTFAKEIYPLAKVLFKDNVYTSYTCELLKYYDGAFDLELMEAVLNWKEGARVVLRKVHKGVFDSYSLPNQTKIFGFLVDRIIDCQIPEVKVAVLRCVRKWTIDSSIVSGQLTKCLNMEKRQSSAPKFSKKADKMPERDWVSYGEVVLELIQGKKRLKRRGKLIDPLFKLLKKCITLEEQAPVEYLKQLVLSSLTGCCQDDGSTMDEEDYTNFDVQTVIDCLRCSRNPQTHHHALILLNYAASRYHEQVLHGVMSLFTFMGNSILRQDDAYSTQLIQQTVSNIIPTLAKTNKGGVHHLTVSAGIYRVFTSAVQDIPVHRRLPVFTSLVQTLNPGISTWQLCIILIDNALHRDRKRSNLNADLELAVNLVWSFGSSVVAQTVTNIYDFLMTVPLFHKTVTPEQFDQMKLRQPQMERSVLDFSRKDNFRDVLITVHYVLELAGQICGKFTEADNESTVEFDSLLQKCLLWSKKTAGLHEEKLFRLITQKNLDVIDKINMTLDPLKFIESITLILVRDDTSVKRKALEMLNQRILQKVEWFGELENLVDLIPLLLEITNTDLQADDAVNLIQTSFFSLKLLAKHLIVHHPEKFSPAFETATVFCTHSNTLLRASALLCLSELFGLKSLILPNLNNVTEAILSALNESKKEIDPENTVPIHLLCISAITCLTKMVEQLGSFVGIKFLRRVFVTVLSIRVSDVNRIKVFETKLKTMLKTVSTKIPLRNMVQAIREAYSQLHNEVTGLATLMRTLQECLLQSSKEEIMTVLESLSNAFLEEFLKVRQFLKEDCTKAEDAVLECLICGIVLKLTESHFRPFYHRIHDWAKDDEAKMITFYRFSSAAAERLKSLFVTFAGYATSSAIEMLQRNATLTKAILRFFFHIFSNDREGFVTTERFNNIVQPLMNLMEWEPLLQGDIPMKDLSNCVIQLAVATNDLNRWQFLIELIGIKAAHSEKQVRMNAVAVLESAAVELSKDFLPLLPPAVPFLAELMNDDDSEVEAATQKLLLKLEEIVGEPLQPYFTS